MHKFQKSFVVMYWWGREGKEREIRAGRGRSDWAPGVAQLQTPSIQADKEAIVMIKS